LGILPGQEKAPDIPVATPVPVATPEVTSEPTPEMTPVPTPTIPPKPETVFYFFDVSQGDAALVQSEGKNMLIDAGPVSSGPRLVEYLNQLNVTTLDYVVASHPYDDHIGGMVDVLKAFDVRTYVDNGMPYSSDLYEKVINAVISDQAVRMIVTAGMTIPFTNTTAVDVIGPYRLTGHQDADSLVLRVSMKNVSVVFPGDSSEVRGPATILKLPDHGSDAGIGPIMNTRPKAVIISLASGNPFGYPRSATLAEIKKQGARVFRTDINGTIRIRTDGEDWSATTAR
jgi:beta-lactamase superfamily II metal-dependent hydrolase